MQWKPMCAKRTPSAMRIASARSNADDQMQPRRDVLKNGYWHAQSLDYLGGEVPRLLEWMRLPGDLVFIFLGALPILLAVGLAERPQPGATRPAAAATS